MSTRWLAALASLTALLTAACSTSGGSAGSAALAEHLYQQGRAYTGCMRAHGVPDFPEPKPGSGGTLIYPLNPPAGMLTSPGYDAAFRACLTRAVIGGRSARYRTIALNALKQAECMRAHGITSYPSPATVNGGIHSPDFTTLGTNSHTLRFVAAARACRLLGGSWRALWWWPAGSVQP